MNRILFLFFRHFLKKVAQPLYALANALLGLCGEIQAEGVLTFARGCEERRPRNERNFTLDRTLEDFVCILALGKGAPDEQTADGLLKVNPFGEMLSHRIGHNAG